jgi:prevent-host-death family protein
VDRSDIMAKTITATEARVHLGEVIRSVNESKEHYIVEKSGTPVAIILSHDEYARLTVSLQTETEPEWMQRAEEARTMIAEARNCVPYTSEEIINFIKAGRDDEDE